MFVTLQFEATEMILYPNSDDSDPLYKVTERCKAVPGLPENPAQDVWPVLTLWSSLPIVQSFVMIFHLIYGFPGKVLYHLSSD